MPAAPPPLPANAPRPPVLPTVPPRTGQRGTALLVLAVLGGGLLAAHLHAAGLIRRLPPCGWYELTHTYCPGCGTTRCLAALARGDVRQALAYNALTVVALPLLALWALAEFAPARWRLRWRPPPQRAAWLARFIVAAVIAFGVLRNVHVYPFTLLAPHVAN